MLHRIARALDVPVAALVSSIDRLHVVSRAADRAAVEVDRAGSRVELLIPVSEEHLLEGHLHVVMPGGGSERVLAHAGEEVGYLVEGRLELTVGTEIYKLQAGDSFNFRSEIAHSYRNPGKTPARVVWVSTPGRRAGRPGGRTG
jgi:mannose-6-phosphate isomerase-like protein (cupin superfamily)